MDDCIFQCISIKLSTLLQRFLDLDYIIMIDQAERNLDSEEYDQKNTDFFPTFNTD